jgi:lipopolysaccharide export LptBFGC system permease protein LptF
MRRHPYVRTALIGLVVGIVAGSAFYLILRAFGTHASRYLLVAIVVAFIPGSVMLSELLEADELDKGDWQEEQEQSSGASR